MNHRNRYPEPTVHVTGRGNLSPIPMIGGGHCGFMLDRDPRGERRPVCREDEHEEMGDPDGFLMPEGD